MLGFDVQRSGAPNPAEALSAFLLRRPAAATTACSNLYAAKMVARLLRTHA